MSVSLRWSGALAAALFILCVQAQAQNVPPGGLPPIPNNTGVPLVAPNNPGIPLAPGAAMMGGLGNAARAIGAANLANAAGINPANFPAVNPLGGGFNPYALATLASANPYGGGALSNPYGLSTNGGAGGWSSYANMGYYPPYAFGGIGPVGGELLGAGYALQGLASLTAATGQYLQDVQRAKLIRYDAIRSSFDTARRRIEFENWYENQKPTAQLQRQREIANELEWTRRAASDTEIRSGKALNVLLKSIQDQKISRNPTIPLDDQILKNINVTTSAGANVGLLKDGGNLTWPEGLQDAAFEESRNRLSTKIKEAVRTLKEGDPVRVDTLRDIRSAYKALTDKMNEGPHELNPDQYIEANRYLKLLSSAIKTMSDPKAFEYFNNTRNAKGKTVAELCEHMTRSGMVFAPAVDGEDSAYRALYQALRSYDAALQYAQR